jgi:TPR repeat protein
MKRLWFNALLWGTLLAEYGICAEQKEIVHKLSPDEFESLWEADENEETSLLNQQQNITAVPVVEDPFSDIKEGWALFSQQKYDEAFNYIYLQSMNKKYSACYLLAQYYEYGLGKIYTEIKSANELYLSVIIHSNNAYLISKAEEGYGRTLESVKAKMKIDTTDLNEGAKMPKPSRSEDENALFSGLGVGWALFTQKRYKEAYIHIYCLTHSSGLHSFLGQYLLAQYHEYGYGETTRNMNHANTLYLAVLLNCDNDLLSEKAEEGYGRTIKLLKDEKEAGY